MTIMHGIYRKPIADIMKAVNAMENDDIIEGLIVRALQDAYTQGFNDAEANPRQPEGMGS